MNIRLASPADAKAISGVMRDSFAEYRPLYTPLSFDLTVLDEVRIAARMEEGPVWVAEMDGKVVGSIGAKIDARGGYCRGLGVAPAARGKRVGALLFGAIEEWAREEGVMKLWLSTTPFLLDSIRLYRKLGFEPAHGPDELAGTPLVSFEKHLA